MTVAPQSIRPQLSRRQGFNLQTHSRAVNGGCSAHGLRKTGACIAAENGATEAQLMAIFGWGDPDMAALYTRKARQKRIAGDAMGLEG